MILVINYNTKPILKNKGSAIFLHLASKKFKSTKGCIAIRKKDFLKILPMINKNKTVYLTKDLGPKIAEPILRYVALYFAASL